MVRTSNSSATRWDKHPSHATAQAAIECRGNSLFGDAVKCHRQITLARLPRSPTSRADFNLTRQLENKRFEHHVTPEHYT